MSWILGYIFSLLVGHFVTNWFLSTIRKKTGCQGENWERLKKYADEQSKAEDNEKNLTYEEPKLKALPPSLQGILERAFFTTIVAFNINGAPIAMMGWLAVKMLTNLNRRDLPRKKIVRLRALTGLQGSLMSMLFAYIGGLICRYNVRAVEVQTEIQTFLILYRVLISFSYISILCGSIGLMLSFRKFPFGTSSEDLKHTGKNLLGLNGYQVWIFSWLLIILGTFIQLINYLAT